MQETWVRSLGREDPLEEEMITHSHILVLDNLKNRGAWQAKVYGVAESDMTEQAHITCRHDFFNLKFVFIYFWLCWLFAAAHRLSLVAASGGYSAVVVHDLLIMVPSLVMACEL